MHVFKDSMWWRESEKFSLAWPWLCFSFGCDLGSAVDLPTCRFGDLFCLICVSSVCFLFPEYGTTNMSSQRLCRFLLEIIIISPSSAIGFLPKLRFLCSHLGCSINIDTSWYLLHFGLSTQLMWVCGIVVVLHRYPANGNVHVHFCLSGCKYLSFSDLQQIHTHVTEQQAFPPPDQQGLGTEDCKIEEMHE
jgi:hypothetical protein